MRNMLTVNKRMTIGTYNHKILSFIVLPVAVNMVYTKYFLGFIISAFFTFLDNSFSLPKSSKIIRTIRLVLMKIAHAISTGMRTIFSFSTRRIMKFFSAQKTIIFFHHASARTQFGRFQSVGRDVKNIIAMFTNKRMFHAIKKG